jgi:chromosomal replication initiator protein
VGGGAPEASPAPASASDTLLDHPTPSDLSPNNNDDIPSLDQCWALAVADVCGQINHHIVAAYIEPLSIDVPASTPDRITVRGPSRLICNYVTSQFGGQLQARLAHFLNSPELQLSIIPRDPASLSVTPANDAPAQSLRRPNQPFVVKRVRPTALTEPKSGAEGSIKDPSAAAVPADGLRGTQPNSDPAVSSSGSTLPETSNINPRYTFSDFVVGNSNQFCHAAAMRVAENPGRSYNPLFIYGGVGLGKTHLLHAIGNAVLERSPEARVLYLSSETFTNELILALRHAKMEEFKRRLRTIEVLLIDDIQFIAGKERTQEEFFHTFNALYSAKRQIVITSDKIPTDIPGIEERLQTRFSWGLTADLQAPDFETRVAILKQKALLESFYLPEEVGHLIAERISSNVRELEGALTRLHAVSTIQHVDISMEMARAALKPLLQPKVVNITVDDIKKAVAGHFSLKVTEIVSKRRTKNLSFPRHIAMYLCRKHTTASYPEIGEHFGGRDHSSVIHAAAVVSGKLSTDAEIKGVVEEIERQLFG